jgi:hypothetical protein
VAILCRLIKHKIEKKVQIIEDEKFTTTLIFEESKTDLKIKLP